MIATSHSPSNSLFSPNIYLTSCQIKFVEKVLVEKRPTVKLRAAQCNVDKDKLNNLFPFIPEAEGLTSNVYNDVNKNLIQFMPETEGVIWIDEQDKAVVKHEIYYRNKTDILPISPKPVVVMKAERISEGFWFWKLITINALENEGFFPKDYGNWQIELFNYKSYKVLIDKVEIDKK